MRITDKYRVKDAFTEDYRKLMLLSGSYDVRRNILKGEFEEVYVVPVPVPESRVYGYLYNGYAANEARGIAASGWSLPTHLNYIDLDAYLTNANPECKEVGTLYWLGSNGTNTAKYNARGSGNRNYSSGNYDNIKSLCQLWTSTVLSSTYRTEQFEKTGNDITLNVAPNIKTGAAIRLIKDFTTLSNGESGTYTGNDGKIYRTICIGTQEWLADNLAETKYADGSWIPGFNNGVYTPITAGSWAALTTGALCAYDNDPDNV
jgi:uncharacterized protein (TIGR02145 family)